MQLVHAIGVMNVYATNHGGDLKSSLYVIICIEIIVDDYDQYCCVHVSRNIAHALQP